MKKSIIKVLVIYPMILLFAIILFRNVSITSTFLLQAYLGYYIFSLLTFIIVTKLKLAQFTRDNLNIHFFTNASTIISIALLGSILLISSNIYNIYFWSCLGILLPINEIMLSIKALQKKA